MDGSRRRGFRPLGVGDTQRSFFVVPRSPMSVLVEVLVEIQHDFRRRSKTVPGSSVLTSNLRTPSPFLLLPRKSSEVPFSSEGGTSQRLGGPGWSREGPGCPENVLVEVLVEMRGVLVENMCVGGILGCRSLTQKFVRQRRLASVSTSHVEMLCIWWLNPLVKVAGNPSWGGFAFLPGVAGSKWTIGLVPMAKG
mgnify:CR=1 FL=1